MIIVLKDLMRDKTMSPRLIILDYQWQKNLEEYGLRFTVGTTNEMIYVRSDLFNGKSNRANNSLYTQLDKNMGD